MISYHFPPSAAVGGLRIADFAKYLPLSGWMPYVLTVKDKYLQSRDAARLGDLNVEKTYKTGHLPTVLQGYLGLKSLCCRILGRSPASPEQPGRTEARAPGTAPRRETALQEIKRFLVSFLTLPDGERSWILPAAVKAALETRRERFDCILTSSPPYSVHLVGLLVKNVTGVRWVADFRDPWASIGSKRLFVTSSLSTRVEKWLEKKVIEKADLVLTTTARLRDHFAGTYNAQPEAKFVHVTNGFDPEIAEQLKHLKKYDTLTLTYTGTLYLGRDPGPVFRAIHDLAQEGNLDLRRIRVKLVGNCRHIDGQPIEKIIQSYGLESVVEVTDMVPHSTALEIVKQSHIALLFAPGQPFQIPAKVFEYIGLGTKILALTEEGATWDLIASTGAGTAYLPSDIDGIKEFIRRLVSDGLAAGQENMSRIQQVFDRRSITRNLAEHLDRIVERAGTPS